MKLFLIIATLLAAQAGLADSFTIIRDGREYVCQDRPGGGQPPQPNPGGAVDCVNKAYAGPFSKEESLALCSGARNTVPAECAIKAYAGPFSKEESLRLCTRTRTIGPVDCAIKAYAGPFSKEESLSLCERGTVANAECAIKAYAGPYSKEESLRMCKSEPHLVLRSLELIAQSQDLKEKVQQIKRVTQ